MKLLFVPTILIFCMSYLMAQNSKKTTLYFEFTNSKGFKKQMPADPIYGDTSNRIPVTFFDADEVQIKLIPEMKRVQYTMVCVPENIKTPYYHQENGKNIVLKENTLKILKQYSPKSTINLSAKLPDKKTVGRLIILVK